MGLRGTPHRTIRRLEDLRKERAKLLSSLTFLLRCRDHGLIPSFAKLGTSIKSSRAQRITERAGRALVRERIQYKRRALDENARKLKSTHLQLATSLAPTDWDYIDAIATAQGELQLRKDTARQIKKFNHLLPPEKNVCPPDNTRTIVNLSEEVLDEPSQSVLSKGLNFATVPRTIPYADIIGGIEQAIRKLSNEEAEEVRGEVTMVLKRAELPKSNITRDERAALHRLRNNSDIVILPADKGNATVIMKRDEYDKKIEDVLKDTAYRPLKSDPTESRVRKTKILIKEAKIPEEERKKLVPQAPVPPRLYGLPKIHKDDVLHKVRRRVLLSFLYPC
ncbi:uncharacterized protein LOC124163714 [Ischnura elegans]|uniref:uncharacterized protein LOC124163714 n=1 Tax=Ischnura elegans TaxID=197161 RepID=UPI001ED8954A|nr:uncharacterized protein LOC124163714 [Ischnura elegans]